MLRARLLVAGFALSVTGCAAADPGPASEASDGIDADITVEMGEMFYEPARITVPAGESVTVRLVNGGSLRHNLVLPDGIESPTLQVDESTVVEIGPLTEPVTAWCSVPGHRNAGMELEIDVD